MCQCRKWEPPDILSREENDMGCRCLEKIMGRVRGAGNDGWNAVDSGSFYV